MTKEEFFKQMDTKPQFPTTEQEVEWWEEWMDLNPKLAKEANEAYKELVEKQASKYMAQKIFLRVFFAKNSVDGYGEFRLVWNNGEGYIHPLGRDGETYDFKLK